MSAEERTSQTSEVWDLPLRLFHWLLTAAVLAAYITSELGGEFAAWHGRIGGLVLGLLVFRVIWGFVGSPYARFSSFRPSVASIRAYLNGHWQGVGHNPLGALAVFTMLLVLLVQVVTGLFSNDDIAFHGPLYGWVTKSTSDALAQWHERSFDILLILIALHVIAIFAYALFKRRNLVLPMLTGKQSVPATIAIQSTKPRRVGLIVAALTAVATVWLVFGVPRSQEPAAAEPVPVAQW